MNNTEVKRALQQAMTEIERNLDGLAEVYTLIEDDELQKLMSRHITAIHVEATKMLRRLNNYLR